MFRSILVPVDRSQRAAPAVATAFSLAAAAGGRVTLLHVVEVIKDTTYEEYGRFYDALAEQARQEMERLVAASEGSPTAPHDAVSWDARVEFGRRVAEILRAQVEGGYDLVVLQSHRLDPADPTRGWGTISHRVGILAACPVLLVK